MVGWEQIPEFEFLGEQDQPRMNLDQSLNQMVKDSKKSICNYPEGMVQKQLSCPKISWLHPYMEKGEWHGALHTTYRDW